MSEPMNYQRSTVVDLPFDDAVSRTRSALAEQGFGVLTEIDVQATLRQKLGVEMEPYLILGACRPDLAHQALEVDRSVGVLLPCNVVISACQGGSKIQMMDPLILAAVTADEAFQPIAQEAARRLQNVLDSLTAPQ